MKSLQSAFDNALESKNSGHFAVVGFVYAGLSMVAVWGDAAALAEATKIACAVSLGIVSKTLDRWFSSLNE